MRTHEKKVYRAPGLIFFPDKLLSQTEHLDEEELGIYWRMCCRIWLFTPTQFSFEDTEDNWRELSGIQESDRIKKIQEKFLKSLHPLFMRSHNQHGDYLIQKGLKKSKELITKKSAQNSANARKRWKSSSYPHATAQKTRMRTHVFGNANISISSLKKACVYNTSTSLKDKDSDIDKDCRVKTENEGQESKGYEKKLGEFLSAEQIRQVKQFCNLSLEYVEEKIRIMLDRRPKNQGAFLYAALTQNYLPAEEKKECRRKATEHPLIKKARLIALNQEEFEELSDNEKERFREVEHIKSERNVYELTSKPTSGENAITRAIFENMPIGGRIEETAYNGLCEAHRKHFKGVMIPPEAIKRFHLR